MSEFRVPYKVDWFQVAFIVPEHFSDSVSSYAESIALSVQSVFDCDIGSLSNGRLNYSHRLPLSTGSDKNLITVGSVQWGGNTSGRLGHHVQLMLTGSNADTFHNSSLVLGDTAYFQRLDIAYDVTDKPYSEIISLCDSLPEFARIKKETYTSSHSGVTATTTYYGSRESAFYIRIYEKGKQTATDPNWVRVEIEIKPNKTSLDFALWCYDEYLSNPENILVRCSHVRAMLVALFDSDLKPYTPRTEKPTPDSVNAFKHLVKQYATTISGVNENYRLESLLDLFMTINDMKQNYAFDSDVDTDDLIDDEIWKFLMRNRRF